MIEALLSEFKWYRRTQGGNWYYVGVLINFGMTKLFFWTNKKPETIYLQIWKIERWIKQ